MIFFGDTLTCNVMEPKIADVKVTEFLEVSEFLINISVWHVVCDAHL